MCKLLAELLGTTKQSLRDVITRLEYSCGEPGVDVRLTSEICTKQHSKLRELGLDPDDTTPRELYQALLNLAAVHDKFLAERLGIKQAMNAEKVYKAVAEAIDKMDMPKRVWALKHRTAKRLLKTLPPKNLMKTLHYRSVDSMLKREPVGALLTAARHLEAATWRHRFGEAYKKLGSSDFEVRDIEVIYQANRGWKELAATLSAQRTTTILHSAQAATIVLMPTEYATKGLTLSSLLLVMHYLNEIKTQSTFTKLHQMRTNHATFIMEPTLKPSDVRAHLAGQPVHWRMIHRYFGSQSHTTHSEMFEPHVQPEDWAYRKAEKILFHLEPALHFWHDLDYVGLQQPGAEPVSFNLMDITFSLINRLPFEKRQSYHLKDSLWNELYIRYMSQASLERHLLSQLEDQLAPDQPLLSGLELAW